MKTLYIDTENGYKTLGNEQDIERMFGYPVLHPMTWQETKRILGQIWIKEINKVTKKIGDIHIDETSYSYVSKNGTSVDTLVFDTATESIKQFQRELKGDGRLTLPMWGELKSDIDMFLNFVNRIPVNVILNVHSKPIRDDDLGIIKYIPNIEGSSKEDMAKWFDFVFYTKVDIDENGHHHYQWVTKRDDRYDHAKDRSGLLQCIIPQDYKLVIEAAKERGWDNIKVLVIGQPGSGKTYSLKSLNGYGEI